MVTEVFMDDKEQLITFLDRKKTEAQTNRTIYDREIWDGYDYYNGKKPLQTVKGGSEAVDRFVFGQVKGLTAQLRDTLVTSDSVVKFSPLFADQGKAAKTATYHINREIIQANDGYNLLNTAVEAALLNKCSYLHAYWVEETKEVESYFDNLSEDDLIAESLAYDEAIVEEEDEETGLLSGRFIVYEDNSHLKIDHIPFEHVYIEPSADSFSTSNYICRKITKMRSEFEAEGIKVPEDAILDESDNETIYNFVRSDEMNLEMREFNRDEETSYVSLYLHYVRMKHKGKYGLWSFLTSLKEIISEEFVEIIPIAQIQPLPTPLAIYGESIPDITKDIQVQKTFILRGMFDNIMDANHPRVKALKKQVNIRALMDRRPDGIIPVDSMGAVEVFQSRPLTNEATLASQLIQDAADTRTGLSNASQGLSDSVFKNDNAYATVEAMVTQALQRTMNMASNIVNGGFSKLMLICYSIVRDNDQRVYTVNLDGRTIQYSPSQWPSRMYVQTDASVSPTDKVAKKQSLDQLDEMIKNDVSLKGLQLFGPEEQYQLFVDRMKARNILNINDYIKPFEMGQPAQPDQMAQAERQAAMELTQSTAMVNKATAQKLQVESQQVATETQFEQEKASNEYNLDVRKQEFAEERAGALDDIEERRMELEELKLELEKKKLILKQQELQLEGTLEAQQNRPVGLGD